jgi:hypothetical protein
MIGIMWLLLGQSRAADRESENKVMNEAS